MLILVMFEHVLVFSEPMAIRIADGLVLLLVVMISGGRFSAGAAQTAWVQFLGGQADTARRAGVCNDIVVAFAIAMPVQVFLSNHLSPAP